MNWIPESVGAEPKKLAFLGGLLALAGVVYFVNRESGPTVSPAAPSGVRAPVAGATLTSPSRNTASQEPRGVKVPGRKGTRRQGQSDVADFRPSLKLPEEVEVGRIDPSLHLNLIAKLRSVSLEGGQRSLFDFGSAPKLAVAPPPAVQPIKPAPLATASSGAPGIAPPAPVKPAPPAIPLKFYGYVNGSVGTSRQAFFLEGDEIYVARENDVIHNRYRIIRIGANTALVEDTTTKDQQTLRLVEEISG